MGTVSVFLFSGALRKASGDDGPTLHEVAPSPTPPQPTLADRPGSVGSDRATRCAGSAFPRRQASELRPTVRDRFGRDSQLERDTEKAFNVLRLPETLDNEMRVLIIPWSQVRVLAGPPSPIGIIERYGTESGGLESPGVGHRGGSGTGEIELSNSHPDTQLRPC